MTKWYRKSFRRNLVDMHIEDWDEEFLSKFEPGVYFENLKMAHIKSTMIYIQSHVGYCYWPTKSAPMHSTFMGRESAMCHLFDLCHNAGMDVIAYYSLIYNNWAYDVHPEWRMINFEGKASRNNGKRYGLCCPNNKDYCDFVFTQIKEFCEYFDFEGIFFDMTFWPMVCYCDSCKKRWYEEVGGSIPKIMDWNDKTFILFQKKRQDWLGEFANKVTAELKKYKPDCAVEHQNSSVNYFWRLGVNENISKASDYCGGDLYGGFNQQSFTCKLYYNLTQNQPFEYMTSRCYPDLLDHTTTKSREMLESNVMLTYAHHGASLLIDAIDPVGTLDTRVYKLMGEVFRKAEKYEPYLEGELVQDVGIYFNLNGKMDVDVNVNGIDSFVENYDYAPHVNAALYTANALKEQHIPFGVVNSWKLELLENLRVLVLPDVPLMEDREIEAVKKFVKTGGKLYLSGHSAPELVEEVFNVKYEGYTVERITYMSPSKEGAQLMSDFTHDYPMIIFAPQVKLSGQGRGEILATMTLPYTIPPKYHRLGSVTDVPEEDEHNSSNTSFRFASIHSNPPGKFTKQPALMYTTYGKGEVIWSAAPLEAIERPQHRKVFASIIRKLGKEFSFSSDAPDVIELVMFKVSEKSRFIISLINTQDRFDPIEVGNFDVHIKVNGKPVRVAILPDEREIPYTYSNGEVHIHINKLKISEMFVVDYK